MYRTVILSCIPEYCTQVMPSARHARKLIAVAAAFALTACSSGAVPTTYDLSAPRSDASGPLSARGQLIVAEPRAVQALDSERILVREATGAISFLGGGQWSDRVPRLVQARLIQTFENVGRRAAVARPGERLVADYQLNTDIRSFQIASATGTAEIEISAQLVNDRSGRVAAARIFRASEPVASVDAGNAAAALDRALGRILIEIVRWSR